MELYFCSTTCLHRRYSENIISLYFIDDESGENVYQSVTSLAQ